MHKILIVGKGSFLARRFLSSVTTPERYLAVSHKQAFDDAIYRQICCVINFAIDPAYRHQPYTGERDIDARIAQIVARTAPEGARYVMLSSRAVYAPEVAMGAREDITGAASSVYGQNKRITERRLGEILGERASLLRIGNVIGDEHGTGRRTFMAQALDRLVTHKEIVLDISPEVRRDFLPDYHFARILEAVCEDPLPGPMNVGSGLPIPVGSVVHWIIDGYGEGTLRVTNHRRHDEFQLDVGKLRARYGFSMEETEIADHSTMLGAQLRRRTAPDIRSGGARRL
jgi:dTDP-4-dehydrorhamnose reductase/UDP-glucose 4-epimerase